MTRNLKISFTYSLDDNLLTIYINKIKKLVELKFNITTLNNLNVILSYNHIRPTNDVSELKIDELVYLLADEQVKQNSENPKQAFLFKCYFEIDNEFKKQFSAFLLDRLNDYYCLKLGRIQDQLDVMQLKEHWLRMVDQNLIVNESNLTSINTLGKMYHHLMHSNYMNIILRQEYLYAVEFNRKLNEFQLLGDNIELVSSRIDSLKLKQQRQFSKLLFKLYDEFNATSKNAGFTPTDYKSYQNELKTTSMDMEDTYDDFEDDMGRTMTMNRVSLLMGVDDEEQRMRRLMLSDPSFSRIEESYTIQLGAQLKTTHNLRLIRCDILDYCRDRFKLQNTEKDAQSTQKTASNPSGDDLLSFVELHTISTAMSLFSENKLCALVILVDACIDRSKYNLLSSRGTQDTSSQFYQICQRNGYDFQFHSIEVQIESAIACINSVNGVFDPHKAKMNIGDFFITKHSNLSQTHVVFHLAAFDSSVSAENSVNSLKKSDLSSRHPVILGLRNILKTCINHNIQTLTFPLLLAHNTTEEMTISWVMKRAELVLKCMKGFMIEFVQWGAQDSRILQFVVPQGLNDETFNSLSALIKTIFRESRTYLLQ